MPCHAMPCHATPWLAVNWFGDVPIQPIPAIRMERVEDATKWGKPSNGWMMKDERLETKEHPSREKEHHNVPNVHTTNNNDNDIASEKASRRALKEPTKQKQKQKQNVGERFGLLASASHVLLPITVGSLRLRIYK